MFPVTTPEVLLVIGMIFISILFNRALFYFITGLLVLFMDLRDTTNQSETFIMASIAIILLYYSVTVKE